MSHNNDSETLSNNNTKKEVQKVLPEENILLNNETIDIIGMGCDDETCHFKPLKLKRRKVTEYDILIEMHFCGVCHSDLHSAAGHNNMLSKPIYPFIPGHELAGIVKQIGDKVDKTKFQIGDQIGVGCMVDSCLTCDHCINNQEQKCKDQIQTYGSVDISGRARQIPNGRQTIGGYSNFMVVHEKFAIKIPKTYPLEKAGPVMCAGITSYEPLIKYGAKPGCNNVGFIGLGGLGVMGVKLAKALGCTCTVISRSNSKKELAKSIGADHYIASSNMEEMRNAQNTFDLIINYIPSQHNYLPYVKLLKKNEGKIVFVGLHATWAACFVANGYFCKTTPCRSTFIGGIKNTQAVIDLCDKNRIYPETTLLPVEKLNEIYENLDHSNDKGTRYVLDIKNSLIDYEQTFNACKTMQTPNLKPSTGGLNAVNVVKEALYMKFCCV
tara:strand:- start:537 stop:1853 length:1317 start_codon:yes stop_codon:yes gene_type:complete